MTQAAQPSQWETLGLSKPRQTPQTRPDSPSIAPSATSRSGARITDWNRPITRIVHTVAATLPDRRSADDYVRWLEGGHIGAVLELGAHSALVVRITDPAAPIRIESRYIFSTRTLFDRYIERHAVALRADGLKRFPPESGVTFARTVGEII